MNRRHIVRAAKQRGWMLHPVALEGIETLFRETSDKDDLEALFEFIAGHMSRNTTVTEPIWKQVADALMKDERQEMLPVKNPFPDLEVISAFRTPRLVYRPTRKQFQVEESRWSLFGEAEDKTNMLERRYYLAQQRILRHELFRPTDLLHNHAQAKLTPIESLLGKASTSAVLLLGVLVQVEEGRYYLEDPTGQVPLSLQQASVVDEFYVTEHCILLVEGTFHQDTLIVHRLGHPLLEERKESLAAIRKQVSHPFYRQLSSNPAAFGDFVILSDVELDRPNVLLHLESIFTTFENQSTTNYPMFVLMGNFSTTGLSGTKQALLDLVALIEKFPLLARSSHFCVVPGPGDVAFSNVLPLQPLKPPPHRIRNLHCTSNPCRIRWGGREMVIFNHNILHLLQQRQLRLPSEMDDETNERMRLPHCRMVKTILDQGHLCPVAGVPIFWNYDHALQLYPLPDTLVLGGSDCERFEEVYGNVDVMMMMTIA
ncbi:DNA polymerase epsilon subunit 2 [Fistulifera solaris]|uniref:DNA polymerase II subunit 2 n=1 Tax=Fistulifera solaris TaxID=1519565 RepID=A0A1Z5KR91_FISSO|nr:DNA polymerase epsilon subunit 2 [Fistulifera solaris]|eukprot:GAX28511.1 DNA polymerase epsilon subunit 2 [Fistulifera solaris]